MDAAANAARTTTTTSPWENYKMSPAELEHFARAVDIAWDHGTSQSDAWRFGFCAGALINMAGLLQRIDPGASDAGGEMADGLSLAQCATTDDIAIWLVTHGKAGAGDVARLRETGWSAGIGALCGYVYRYFYVLRRATGQQD